MSSKKTPPTSPVHRVVRQLRWIWSVVSGQRRARRDRIARRKMARAFDRAERQLEALKEKAIGRERIACINDLHWVRCQRTLRGV